MLKGPQTLISVFRGHRDADLLIVGRGPLEGRLKKMAGESRGIRFAGFKSSEELSALYRGARGVIIPSECYETFPLVAVESMQHGTPVIARKRGGLPESVEDTGGGLLYDTPDELSRAVNRLVKDEALYRQLSRKALEGSRGLWCPESPLKSYLGLIDSLVGSKKD